MPFCDSTVSIMGWLGLRRREPARRPSGDEYKPVTDFKTSTEHVEIIEPDFFKSEQMTRGATTDDQYPLQDVTISDDSLPFIPPTIVRSQRSQMPNQRLRIWIVIDNVVYDCTNFIHSHPGGDTVIRSFIGEDSSWQFWRFHSRSLMDTFGRPLRIGQTMGVENRFKEPPRYVGASKSRW